MSISKRDSEEAVAEEIFSRVSARENLRAYVRRTPTSLCLENGRCVVPESETIRADFYGNARSVPDFVFAEPQGNVPGYLIGERVRDWLESKEVGGLDFVPAVGDLPAPLFFVVAQGGLRARREKGRLYPIQESWNGEIVFSLIEGVARRPVMYCSAAFVDAAVDQGWKGVEFVTIDQPRLHFVNLKCSDWRADLVSQGVTSRFD